MPPTNSNLTNNAPKSGGVTQPSQQQLAGPAQAIVQQAPQQPPQTPPGLSQGQVQSLMPSPPHPQSLIPELCISRDTIEYVGFTPQAADKMWDAWVQWPKGLVRRETDPDDGRPSMTFLQFMIRYIDCANDAAYAEFHEWGRCMDGYGFSGSTQDSVLQVARTHHHVFHADCSYWSKRVVLLHYEVSKALRRTCSLNMMRPDPTRKRALPARFRK